MWDLAREATMLAAIGAEHDPGGLILRSGCG